MEYDGLRAAWIYASSSAIVYSAQGKKQFCKVLGHLKPCKIITFSRNRIRIEAENLDKTKTLQRQMASWYLCQGSQINSSISVIFWKQPNWILLHSCWHKMQIKLQITSSLRQGTIDLLWDSSLPSNGTLEIVHLNCSYKFLQTYTICRAELKPCSSVIFWFLYCFGSGRSREGKARRKKGGETGAQECNLKERLYIDHLANSPWNDALWVSRFSSLHCVSFSCPCLPITEQTHLNAPRNFSKEAGNCSEISFSHLQTVYFYLAWS